MSFFNGFFDNPNQEFIIYTNDVLKTDQGANNPSAAVGIKLTALHEFSFMQTNTVASEPLERGQFASDSIQVHGHRISAVVKYVPSGISLASNSIARQAIQKVHQTLEKYCNNSTLLTILMEKPLFNQYPNLKLYEYKFDQTSMTPNILKAFVTFQYVRFNQDTSYSNQPKNPENGNTVDNGNQSATNPTNPGIQGNAA